MNRLYITLGALALLLSAVSARAELEASPGVRETCCDMVQYNVKLSNPAVVNRMSFALDARSLDSGDIWVSLEPDIVVVPAKGETDLIMFARPECGLPPGAYRIRLTAECDNACMNLTETAEVVLRVREGCSAPQKPDDEADDDQNDLIHNNGQNILILNNTGDDDDQGDEELSGEDLMKDIFNKTSTGAAIASDEDMLKIGIIFVLLVVSIALIALIKTKSR